MYEVRALPITKSGTTQVEGYVPFIVRSEDGGIVEFAVYDGNFSGNRQPRHPTPEAAMGWYEEHESKTWPGEAPDWGHLQKIRRVQVETTDSTAGAV